jgi:hypothetical protein
MKLQLPQVTLVNATNLAYKLPSMMAMDRCREQCDFGRTIQFNLGQGSIADYNHFIMKEMARTIETAHLLICQWDGFIVDTTCWDAEFLKYDYIGACWPLSWPHIPPTMQVGNGGFSLRSKRLMDIISHHFEVLPELGEDEQICRTYRRELELNYGIKYAPPELARRFSYEYEVPAIPSFGFHGLHNAWRHVTDKDLETIVFDLPRGATKHIRYKQLAATYWNQQRWVPYTSMFVKHEAETPETTDA